MKKDKLLLQISNFYTFLGLVLLVVSVGIFLVPTIPFVVYRLNPAETEKEITSLSTDISAEGVSSTSIDLKYIPPIDPSLPETPFVRISKIGVNSPISAQTDYISALKKGTWMVPEFGSPTNGKSPIILAAHRFGYRTWTKEFRNTVSFYNLPKTEVGDIIDIIWEQRNFKYEIYAIEESNYITDYDADLILYTCKFFNTPVRIFRYAKLIQY